MKKFVGLIIIFIFILTLMLGVSVFAKSEGKIIHYVTENKDTVDVVVKVSGEVNQLLGFTMNLPYNKSKLEFKEDSFTRGELLKGWIMPNVQVNNFIANECGIIYYTASPVLEKDLYYSVSYGEEKTVASFSFNKINGAKIDENTIYQSKVFYGMKYRSSEVNVFKGDDIKFDTMPERFITVFKPYSETGISSVSGVNITNEDDININNNIYMMNNSTKQFKANVVPIYATNKNIVWSATGAVSVDENGLVTANSVGDGSVTVTTEDGNKTATVNIKVQENEVKPTSIQFSSSKANIIVGNGFTFSAKLSPDDVTNDSVIWTVSNDCARIDEITGTMRALKAGTVTVTATSVSDSTKYSTFDVTVNEAAPISIEAASASVIIPSVIYPNTIQWKDKTYKAQFTAFSNFNIPYDAEISAEWAKYYYVEYSDNFAGKGAVGIERDGNIITVKSNAADVKGLKITATLKNKADDSVVLTTDSNSFDVVSNLKINSINISGAAIAESSGADGVNYKNNYKLTAGNEQIEITFNATRAPYIAYTINGGAIIKTTGDITIDPSELNNGENKINIYVHNDNRLGAFGYKLNSLIDQIKLTVNK